MTGWFERKSVYFGLVLVLSAGNLTADEHHDSNEIPCSDCHTMHYGDVTFDREPLRPGGPFEHLLLAPEDELCLSCHDGTDPSAPNVVSGEGAELSGGWFTLGSGSDENGHTLGSRELPPGSTRDRVDTRLRCISCHDPHGNKYYRNLRPAPGGGEGPGLTSGRETAGSSNTSVLMLDASGASRYAPESVRFHGSLQTGQGAHISAWCGGCHTMMHGDGGDPEMGGSLYGHREAKTVWLQHPVKGIPMSLSVKNGHDENRGWFEDYASRLSVASSGEVPGTPAASDNEITCLTCHAAHGSGFRFSLIYDDAETVLERDGRRLSQSCRQCHRFGHEPFEHTLHGDPENGVQRTGSPDERGECSQCHIMHGAVESGVTGGEAFPYLLFTENGNNLCYGGGDAGGCHRDRPFNYPARESDRMPEYADNPGYFEFNNGAVRIPGVNKRNRWPGEQAYENPLTYKGGKLFSPHAFDQDMPIVDESGQGACRNCHDPHEGDGSHDLLVMEYGPVSGAGEIKAPAAYDLCLGCHSFEGPVGMDIENKWIRDYYDSSINEDLTTGHQIRFNPRVALSWPSNVELGDKLPCYDCHNPHGSWGNDGTNPNGYLISDERPDWSGLTDTLDDPGQSRRFCLGCHISSDGEAGSRSVEGIIMNTISSRKGHLSSSGASCHTCHGGDYSTSNSFNVHHPAGGAVAIEKEKQIR